MEPTIKTYSIFTIPKIPPLPLPPFIALFSPMALPVENRGDGNLRLDRADRAGAR